ncbi:unnamed protein product [Periconia digitata]|uniref:Cytochrome P450 monooxygenase n=1 Tax=Periconia digitata TaxID=1303443 RepID=A0A9W4UT87_9PLEO|nr:unnamed protein product [Periconia digitata]
MFQPIISTMDSGTSPVLTASILVVVTIGLLLLKGQRNKLPHVNPIGIASLQFQKQLEFIKDGLKILERGRSKYLGQPFRMLTTNGELTVLPPEYANMIRNETGLSFAKAIVNDFSTHVPGFDPIAVIDHNSHVVQDVARKQLTKLLNTVTEPLAQETTFAVHHIFGNSLEWQQAPLADSILNLVARLSSRVFLGEELCRDEEWLAITKEYTVDGFRAAVELAIVPQFLKFLLPLFSSKCQVVRRKANRAREIITPVIENRRALKNKARLEGKPIPSFNDALDWGETETKGMKYNPADFQLTLAFAAIHTTSDLLCKTLGLLAEHPDSFKPLREEMITVLKQDGWKKSALYNMKLLDSTLKEAQRVRPNSLLSMRRVATKDVKLQNGFTIRRGENSMVDARASQDPTIFPEPEKFDIYRFLRMREQPQGANKAQLVATSPEHIHFGHGTQACPGRFFAANEMKIALCHLLLKYDWELAPGSTSEPVNFGVDFSVNPETQIRFKRREIVDIDLESLVFD